MTVHMVIPDLQSKPGTPTAHLDWIGRYAVEKKPDVIVQIGDMWDMPSLSAWDKGKLAMEGRRYEADVEKGNSDLALLTEPIVRYNKRHRITPYNPRLVLLRGNHEHRIIRAVEDNPHLEGTIGYRHLLSPMWEVHDYLKPVWIDGVCYSHVFVNSMTGRPLGGLVSTRLKTLGHSFVMGHQQTLDSAIRFIPSPNGPKMQRGLVCGAAYLHLEDYLGFQGNAHWRGIVMLHEVVDGSWDQMEVSMDFLSRKFEGQPLDKFMQANYPQWSHQ